MNKKEFYEQVMMAVEIEYEDGGRCWHTMPCKEVNGFLKDTLDDEAHFSDMDFCATQKNPEIQKVLDKANEMWADKNQREKLELKCLGDAVDKVLEMEKPRRIWTEEEIRHLVQVNDKVLYGALRKMYDQQTADEQADGETKHNNGVGFNGADAKIMSSFAQFLKKTGFLTPKQKAVARRKLVKYNRQLTKLANA